MIKLWNKFARKCVELSSNCCQYFWTQNSAPVFMVVDKVYIALLFLSFLFIKFEVLLLYCTIVVCFIYIFCLNFIPFFFFAVVNDYVRIEGSSDDTSKVPWWKSNWNDSKKKHQINWYGILFYVFEFLKWQFSYHTKIDRKNNKTFNYDYKKRRKLCAWLSTTYNTMNIANKRQTLK